MKRANGARPSDDELLPFAPASCGKASSSVSRLSVCSLSVLSLAHASPAYLQTVAVLGRQEAERRPQHVARGELDRDCGAWLVGGGGNKSAGGNRYDVLRHRRERHGRHGALHRHLHAAITGGAATAGGALGSCARCGWTQFGDQGTSGLTQRAMARQRGEHRIASHSCVVDGDTRDMNANSSLLATNCCRSIAQAFSTTWTKQLSKPPFIVVIHSPIGICGAAPCHSSAALSL